jgi:transposase
MAPDASWLFPPSPRDWLPEEHLVYFLLDVTALIDVSPIGDEYDTGKGGQPPFHPRMMLVLLLYSYRVGVFSSRKIMPRCTTDAAFRIIVGEDIPNFRRIAEFRARHLKHLPLLFLEVLVLCRKAGLLKVGRLSLDGTKIKANASRNKAMSYDRMGPEIERLQQEIDALLAQADGADAEDDDKFGDLPDDENSTGTETSRKSTGEDSGSEGRAGRSGSANGSGPCRQDGRGRSQPSH